MADVAWANDERAHITRFNGQRALPGGRDAYDSAAADRNANRFGNIGHGIEPATG